MRESWPPSDSEQIGNGRNRVIVQIMADELGTDEAPSPSAGGIRASHMFAVVLRASSAIRIPSTKHMQMNIVEDVGQTTLTFRTRYLSFGGEPEKFPRELWVEAWVPAADLDEAMRRGQDRANTVTSVLSMAMNAATEHLQIEFAFDICAEHDDHQFFENCMLDESGLPRLARTLDVEECLGFLGDLMAHPAVDRLLRAISQYEVALRYWLPGQETLALGHLYMAMEALTPVVRDIQIAEYGGRDALTDAWGVAPTVCRKCGEQIRAADLDAETRRRVLFQGEDQVYQGAKRASDALEHGFLAFDAIREQAVEYRDRLGFLVRHAVMDVAGPTSAWRDALLTPRRDAPIPAARAAKYVRCTLNGDMASLAPANEQYPRFQLESSIKSINISDDGVVTVEPEEKLTAFLGDGIQATDLRFEVWAPGPIDRPKNDSPSVVDE
jgi:hypothetical protein